MWNDLTNLGVSAPEKIVRTIVIYLVLAVLLRLAGKRDLAQLNSFDLVVMLLLSNVVQNAVIGQDDSLLGGIIGAVVLVGFNAAVVRASLTSEGVHRLMEGTSTVLARHGVWDTRALRHEGLRKADVDAALRRQNANDVRRDRVGQPRARRGRGRDPAPRAAVRDPAGHRAAGGEARRPPGGTRRGPRVAPAGRPRGRGTSSSGPVENRPPRASYL